VLALALGCLALAGRSAISAASAAERQPLVRKKKKKAKATAIDHPDSAA